MEGAGEWRAPAGLAAADFPVVARPAFGYLAVMIVTLPDDLEALRGLDERALKRELAVALYAGGKVTIVQAADLAETGLFEFQATLRERRIPQHYDQADLEADMRALRELPE